MASAADIHTIFSPWGRFGLYSYFIDAPEPAIIDTGIATSPREGIAPALEALGRSVEEVRWILLTHGHIDHLGGAHALWEMTGRQAKVVIHEADAHLLRSRRAHVDLYLQVRHQYLNAPDGEQEQIAMAGTAIAGEMQPTMTVTGGETLDLGAGVSVSVHHIAGHTAGSVAYVVDGQGDTFVGDAVQIHGAANGFPGYEDPASYRTSLKYLLDDVVPRRIFLGHPYRNSAGQPYEVELPGELATRALRESLEAEQRISAAAVKHIGGGLTATDSPYSPFEPVARALPYTGDPAAEPSPFFTTMHGYAQQLGVTAPTTAN